MKTSHTNDDRPRGQIGIGTLTIFIAMMFVAAGVLPNNSGLFQSKAEDTGSDAQTRVSTQIDVVYVAGEVDGSRTSG